MKCQRKSFGNSLKDLIGNWKLNRNSKDFLNSIEMVMKYQWNPFVISMKYIGYPDEISMT